MTTPQEKSPVSTTALQDISQELWGGPQYGFTAGIARASLAPLADTYEVNTPMAGLLRDTAGTGQVHKPTTGSSGEKNCQ